VFLSHKSEVKKETAELKDSLRVFGISCFVAHDDIHPTKEWQDEIENALGSMDGFVALMTEGFHDSLWTDQEVGFAVARGVPIVAARLGKDPYGFIGKFQALSCTWQTACEKIVKVFIKNGRMFESYVRSLRTCPDFDTGFKLAKALPHIEQLTAHQIDELVSAYNENDQIHWCLGFSGMKPKSCGKGIVSHLNRLGPRQFRFTESRVIEIVP
jgi:hypothetical protein